MKTKAIKDFKIGEKFTLTECYDENTPVYVVERLLDNDLVIARDFNGWGRVFEQDEEYYPIYFSSLDGMAYRI